MAGGADFVAYATAKAGVVGLTNSLAREFGSDNYPGQCHRAGRGGDRAAAPPLVHREIRPTRFAARQMIKRRLLPDEIARAALFLAADDSRMITKQCLVVDAGMR